MYFPDIDRIFEDGRARQRKRLCLVGIDGVCMYS
jgi:hypothetical protein